MWIFVSILANLCQSNIALKEKLNLEKYVKKMENCKGVFKKVLKINIIFSKQYCFERVFYFTNFINKFEPVLIEVLLFY